LLCNFLQSPFTSFFFGPNILLSTLISNILSLCSSLNARDQVSHPYRMYYIHSVIQCPDIVNTYCVAFKSPNNLPLQDKNCVSVSNV
jgi:hypothetical protein